MIEFTESIWRQHGKLVTKFLLPVGTHGALPASSWGRALLSLSCIRFSENRTNRRGVYRVGKRGFTLGVGETTYSCIIFYYVLYYFKIVGKPTFAPPCIFTFYKVLARTRMEAENTWTRVGRLETQEDPKKMFRSSTRTRGPHA